MKEAVEGSQPVAETPILSDGVYVKGLVFGVPVTFTADTGASKTIISSGLYQKISAEERPPLSKSTMLRGAGGSPIREWGKGVFRLTLGPLELLQEVVTSTEKVEQLAKDAGVEKSAEEEETKPKRRRRSSSKAAKAKNDDAVTTKEVESGAITEYDQQAWAKFCEFFRTF